MGRRRELKQRDLVGFICFRNQLEKYCQSGLIENIGFREKMLKRNHCMLTSKASNPTCGLFVKQSSRSGFNANVRAASPH